MKKKYVAVYEEKLKIIRAYSEEKAADISYKYGDVIALFDYDNSGYESLSLDKEISCEELMDWGEYIFYHEVFINGYNLEFILEVSDLYGLCDYPTKTIYINLNKHFNLGELIDTLAHEFAHTVIANHNIAHLLLTKKYRETIQNTLLVDQQNFILPEII
jgi:hypothetical protein